MRRHPLVGPPARSSTMDVFGEPSTSPLLEIAMDLQMTDPNVPLGYKGSHRNAMRQTCTGNEVSTRGNGVDARKLGRFRTNTPTSSFVQSARCTRHAFFPRPKFFGSIFISSNNHPRRHPRRPRRSDRARPIHPRFLRSRHHSRHHHRRLQF